MAKRALSLLSALALLAALLPSAVLSGAALPEERTFQACECGPAITMDGAIKETVWALSDAVGESTVGFLCRQSTLYIGLRTAQSSAAFTVNGVRVTADLSAKTISVGTIAVSSAGTAELALPMSALGLAGQGAESCPIVCTLGSDVARGRLFLRPAVVTLADDFDDISAKSYASKLNGPDNEVYAQQADGGLQLCSGTLTQSGASMSQPYWTLSSTNFSEGTGFTVELTADFNDLVIPNAQVVYHALSGVAVDVRGENWQLRWGFHSDEEGNVLLTQYETSADQVVTLDTGLDLPAAGARVCFETSAQHDTEVFVNGARIGAFAASARKPSAATKNRVFIYNTTLYRGSDARGSDVVLYDLRMTQPGPETAVGVTYLADGLPLTADGLLDEIGWVLDTRFGDGTALGAMCDSQKLCLAVRTDAPDLSLTLGGASYACTLGDAPAVTEGAAAVAGGGGAYELAIPLSALGADPADGQSQLACTLTVGGRARELILILPEKTLTSDALTIFPASTDGGVRQIEAFLRTDELVLDGRIDEDQWYLPHMAAQRSGSDAPGAGVGALWDGGYLYLGVDILSADRLRALALTVNGRTVGADLRTGTADAGSMTVQAFRQLEWAVPLSALGLTGGVGETADYELTLTGPGGVSGLSGQLTLSGKQVVLGDSCDDGAVKSFSVAKAAAKTTWTQRGGSYHVTTPSSLTGNETMQVYRGISAAMDDAEAPSEFTVDLTVTSLPAYNYLLGKRGLSFDLCLSGLQARYNLRNDGQGNVLLDVLAGAPSSGDTYCVTCDTTVDVGQRAALTFTVDRDRTLRLSVDGVQVARLPKLDRFPYVAEETMPTPRLGIYAMNSNRLKCADGKLYGINVSIHKLLWTQTGRAAPEESLRASLALLDEQAILNGNADALALTGPLALPATLTDPLMERDYALTWTATDVGTGRPSDALNAATGEIRPGTGAALIDLVASVTAGGVSASRTFSVQVEGSDPGGKVSFLENDDEPRTGRAGSFARDAWVQFDTTHNSVVYDQGSVKAFDRIILTDSDGFSRVSKNDLGVFVSDDNVTYTKIADFLLHQNGSVYTIYGLDAEARYVKVHTYHDDLESVTFTTYTDPLRDTQPSFRQRIQKMITVGSGPYLPGAYESFAHSAEIAVPNAWGAARKDEPVYLAMSDLPAAEGEYRASRGDFRFLQDGRMLAHYWDGTGFWVRIPELPVGGTRLTVCWGSPSAEDFSDGSAVFEAVYGNVSLINLSKRAHVGSLGRAFTFPDSGDVLVVASRDGGLVTTRSTDGGRTFETKPTVVFPKSKFDRGAGFGGFLYDDVLNRLYLIAYSVTSTGGDDNDISLAEGRLALLYTEDDGYTWSEPRFLTDANATPVTENDCILKNSQNRRYAVTYCDGLRLKDADGAGPNVDYVLMHGFMLANGGIFGAAAMYSSDGGETWSESTGCISMPVIAGHENGISETGLAQLDDGTLYIVARAQQDNNYYLYEAYSDDFGDTWRDVGPSQVISTNTSPVLAKYSDSERLLMWAGNNSLGGNARRRLPMTLAISTDEYKSYERSLDLTLGTSFDTLIDAEDRMTQPSLSFSPDGTEAFVCWTNLRMRQSVGFLVESFDRMIHDTKGAFDDFEVTSLKNEGWLRDFQYCAALSDEQAASGSRSMKLTDTLSTSNLYALRQIPSMRAGTVGMSLYVPSGNSDAFSVELKAGYNFTWLRHTLAAFTVAPNGTVSVANAAGGQTAVGKVQTDRWNTFALYFDAEVGQARLTINGQSAGQFTMMDQGDRVTVVQIGIPETSEAYGSALYVDDFYAVERQAVSLPQALERVDDAAPAPVGVPGDLTGDGKVNGKDVVLLQRYLAGGYDVTLSGTGDLTGDGKVNGKDVVLLQRYLAGGYDVTLA